ncbi:ParB/RepB/Spo0J family partition protein [Desulforegula conservatrix]|uniref:ParB/RepB/Spo0J family partition protein n=1 Tax=Desulforegula conservatrix TaxID=153026 RepID=UPI000414A576|nr:ParB N-terminal domain-containing protein [Desulforegula conservatrix]
MRANAIEVDLNHIDFDDNRYRTRYECSVSDSDLSELSKSIDSVGVINPPVLSFDSGRYVSVSGNKRLLAAKTIGLHRVFCLICEESPVDTYKIAITENIYTYNYSELDKALIVKNLFDLMNDRSIDSVLEILNGIPALRMNRDYIKRLIKLDGIPSAVKNAISDGIVSPSIALEFDFWEHKDSETLLFFLQQFKIGLNLQREFCNLIYEISKIDGAGIVSVLSTPVFTDIINSSIDVSKKRELVLSELRKIRYPHIEKAKRVFAETAKKIVKNDNSILFMQPKNMELSEVSVSFSFKTMDDYKKRLRKLEEIEGNAELEDLLDINITI